MHPAPLPDNESARLARLAALAVLDSDAEPMFDSFTRVASVVCNAPIALVSLVDEHRQWFKSAVGLPMAGTRREDAFCAHTILGDELMEVRDAAADERFAGNPLVTGEQGIRFYAGAPIVMPGGERVGTVCVLDREPRTLEPGQRHVLIELSHAVAQALLIRESLIAVVGASPDAILGTNARGEITRWNPAAERILGYRATDAVGQPLSMLFAPDRLEAVSGAIARTIGGEQMAPFESTCLCRDGREVAVSVALLPVGKPGHGEVGLSIVLRDIQALKAVERSLREGKERYRILSDASPTGVFHTDADGHCNYTNQRWQEIFGLTLEQSLGDKWGQTLHPEDRRAVQEAWGRAAINAADFAMDFRVLRPDGTTRHVRSRGRPVPGDRGRPKGYVGVVEDVSDLVDAERRLRASETLLDRTGRMAGVGGWIVDLDTEEVTWSDQTCRIHDREPGYKPTLAEGISHYPPESRPIIERAVRDSMERGASWDLELPFVTATGRAIWVRTLGEVDFEDGRAVRIIGAFQDITARRQAEDALQESRRLLRVLYEATPAMLHSSDADGLLLTVSDVWLATLGYRREEVIGRPITDFLTEDSRVWLLNHVRKELFRVGAIRKVPFQMVCRDGTVRDVITSSVIDLDARGERRRTLVYHQDVTEDLARKVELERERTLRQQIERHAADLNGLLAERSDMLDVLAHEVRQPLNNASAAMQSAASALAGEAASTGASARLERAQSVLSDVLAGIDNTLAAAALLAGNGPVQQHDTDIDTLVGVTIGDLRTADRGRVIVVRDTTTRTATMDMGLMRLALRNLLANALKYSPAPAPVTLRIADSDDPLALILEVSDCGSGFAAPLLARLYERGARGSSTGHGLGLHIVKRVMELHGGSVELVRNTAQGSTFRLVVAQSAG